MSQGNVSSRKRGFQVGPPHAQILGLTPLGLGWMQKLSFICVLDRALGPEALMSLPQSPGLQQLGF